MQYLLDDHFTIYLHPRIFMSSSSSTGFSTEQLADPDSDPLAPTDAALDLRSSSYFSQNPDIGLGPYVHCGITCLQATGSRYTIGAKRANRLRILSRLLYFCC